MADREPNRTDAQGTRFSRVSRNASFWILILLIPLLGLNLLRGQEETALELNYSPEFRQELSSGNVLEVAVEGRTMEGEFRNTVSREGRDYQTFRVLFPTNTIPDDLLGELIDQGVTVDGQESSQAWWGFVVGVLPWLLFIAFWFWIFRTMQSGGNRAFQFGRSKAKLISPDTPKLTFADVAGADEAKEELQEIIEFLKDPQRFSRLGGRLPKGVLLIGPPGTGKTLLAKAVAGEAGRPFFQMSGSDFVEMFVGVGASRVRDLFEQGKAHAPCIIFVDEIDAVGRHRGAGLGGGHDEREQTLNALLVEMDGFETNEGVILLAATNRPDVLDPALLRPGRFDRQVVVDAPDVKGREAILRVHARKLPLADDVELSILAKGTPGLSGADLANLCNESALLAAREGADRVSMSHFERAKDKVMLGTERRSMVLTENEKRLTAYHEAGHAVIGLRVPGLDPVHKVTIVPRGRALGITASLPSEDRHSYTKDWLEGQLVMLFGGRVAEEMIFGPEKVTTGAGNDIERATALSRRMVTKFGMSERVGLISVGDSDQEVFLGREIQQRREVSEHTARLVDEEVKRILDEAHQEAREVIDQNRDLLERIAQALLERETIDREDITRLERGEPLLPPRGSEPREEAPEHVPSALPSPAPTASAAPASSTAEQRAGKRSGSESGEATGSPAPAARLGAGNPEADASR